MEFSHMISDAEPSTVILREDGIHKAFKCSGAKP